MILCKAIFSTLSLAAISLTWASQPLLPYSADDRHLGVATCASSTCHGAVLPFPDSRILHNEFVTWQTDRYGNMHAKAYAKLLTPESVRIAEKLGIGPPEQAAVCLDCHADHVPEERRGERFQLSDGVGCEACHGGAEHWLSSHTGRNRSLADNLADGMYPTHDPVHRATLCLSCHMGNEDRMITHRIMAAGHPRLSFELDTFTYLQPHHALTEAYSERKGRQDGVRDWAIGQALAARQLLTLLASPEHGWNGLFPELVLFDCHACHRSMTDLRWAPRPGTGLGPGAIRLNDANLVMLRLIMVAVDAELSADLQQSTRAMHKAGLEGREVLEQSATQLVSLIDRALDRVVDHEFGPRDLRAIFAQLIAEGERGELLDYVAAEQAAMAVTNLVAAYQRMGLLEERALDAEIDAIYAAVRDEQEYRAASLVESLRRLVSGLPGA